MLRTRCLSIWNNTELRLNGARETYYGVHRMLGYFVSFTALFDNQAISAREQFNLVTLREISVEINYFIYACIEVEYEQCGINISV